MDGQTKLWATLDQVRQDFGREPASGALGSIYIHMSISVSLSISIYIYAPAQTKYLQ